MRLVSVLADERQRERRLPDLPRPSDEDHLARQDGRDGGLEVAASGSHGVDNTPLMSKVDLRQEASGRDRSPDAVLCVARGRGEGRTGSATSFL